MSIARWLEQHSAQTALIFEDQTLSYRDLNEAVARCAGWLRSRGITKGERIAYCGFNHLEQVILLFAAARIGAMFLPLNWRLSAAEIAWIVADAAPSLIVADEKNAHLIEDANAPILALEDLAALRKIAEPAPVSGSWGDPLLLVYTSGTTGRPKGAVLTQNAVRANAEMSVHMHELSQADRVLIFLPLFHVGGLNILLTPALSIGAAAVLMPSFDPARAMALFEAQAISAVIVVPTVLAALMAQPNWGRSGLPALRVMSIGSTDVPRSMLDEVLDLGIPIIQIYGATETGPMAIYQTPDEARPSVGALGRAGLKCQIRLTNRDGGIVEIGEIGEIEVKSAAIFQGYWNAPEATDASMRDGWFKTGDAARLDRDGYYWFADRIKHVIISGGENIYPAELARLLEDCDLLHEFAVVGRAHDKWGHVPVVVGVRANDEVREADILARFDGKIARFKQPKDVVFVDALPRNAMGKIVVAEVEAMIARSGLAADP